MIMNPAIQGGGTEEKKYKITNQNTVFIFQEQASAGEIVMSENENRASKFHGVRTLDGGDIPYLTSSGTIIPQQSRAGEIAKIYFVMPAQDVTIIE